MSAYDPRSAAARQALARRLDAALLGSALRGPERAPGIPGGGPRLGPDMHERARLRSLAVKAHAFRLGRIADKEDLGIEELEEALRLLSTEHPATRAEILDIVEKHGLEGACEALSGAR